MLNLILELRDAQGATAKRRVIAKYKSNKWFTLFLYYLLNPTITFGISEKTLRERKDDTDDTLFLFKNIFECCEYLSRLKGVDDATIRQVETLLSTFSEEERNIYVQLLAKTLRLGVTAKTVNKEINGLIPKWDVQRATPIKSCKIPDGENFWITQKLNGLRATFYNGELVARSGIPYGGLDHIISDISWVTPMGMVLDGELTLKESVKTEKGLNDNAAFRVAAGVINSEDDDKSSICFNVFDVIPGKDFDRANPSVKYSVRRAMMDSLQAEIMDSDNVKVLPVLYYGNDQGVIPELLNRMEREDKEGLIINLDVPYRREKHKGIIKVKKFYTMDLPIIGFQEGNGKLKEKLGALIVDYNGNEVRVGGGFTDEQREEFWKRKESLIGTLCEVQYKEISEDKNTGLKSLQFPVFVTLREDKTEISYE